MSEFAAIDPCEVELELATGVTIRRTVSFATAMVVRQLIDVGRSAEAVKLLDSQPFVMHWADPGD